MKSKSSLTRYSKPNQKQKDAAAKRKAQAKANIERDIGEPWKNYKTGRPTEWTDEMLHDEAVYLEWWADQPDSIVIGEGYTNRGYTNVRAREFAVRSLEFRMAREYALYRVGQRREKMGLTGDVDTGIVRYTMGLYDSDLDAWLDKKAQLAKAPPQTQEAITPIINVIHYAPPAES